MAARSSWALAGLALLAAPIALNAQGTGTVSGRVIDQQTGQGLVGARIHVVGHLINGASRNDGTYSITLPSGTQEIRVGAIGYVTGHAAVTVLADGATIRNIELTRAAVALEEIAVTGTRRPDRSAIDQAVPVDVLTQDEIRQTGRTETAQILQALAPSLNFPRATVADGTDHARPATLRGLGADQVLVLINGKRRHASALINVNGTVGRGQGMVDLDAIPSSAIDRIEILRDGAAAQYGSDAIAGVINIILKTTAPNDLTATLGQTARGDGDVVNLNGTGSIRWGDNGFIAASAELRDRGYTNRSLADPRTQYFPGDPKNSDPRFSNRIDHRQGDADTRDAGGFVNASRPLGGATEFYSTIGWSRRVGDAAGFFRRANDDRTQRSLYPNGFLPFIHSTIYDGSAVAGVRGEMLGWRYDVSAGDGRNSFRFDVRNSVNVSLGAASPTEFYAGMLVFGQFTGNVDLVKGFKVGLASPLSVAFGAEFRSDRYQIKAGEPDSYRDGGVPIQGGPDDGMPAPTGSQVFPGFRPAVVLGSALPGDAVKATRNNAAGYADLEANVTRQLVLGAAARAEHYSDFGGTGDFKVSARYEPVRGVAVRAAYSTGFRAPSLGQSWFSSTATNFVAGVPTDNRTFPVSNPVAMALGAAPLKPEQSRNISAGIAFYRVEGFSVTVDYYRILIDDRIVLSGTFNQPAVVGFLQSQGITGVGGARFFTNAISTGTAGVDIVAGYALGVGPSGSLRLTAGFNHTQNRVTAVDSTPGVLASFNETLFDRVERARIEVGQPKDNFNVSGILTWKEWTLDLRTQRFGEVTSFGTPTDGSLDQTFGAKWISDVSLGYTYHRRLTLRLGADNIGNVYPDRNNNDGPIATNPNTNIGGNSNFGIFPYNGISPFGFNGRFAYLRMSWQY